MRNLTITCTRCMAQVPLGQEKDLVDENVSEVYVFCQKCYDEVYYEILREEARIAWECEQDAS